MSNSDRRDDVFVSEASQALMAITTEQQYFTTDDIWERVTTKPQEPRSISAIINRAKSAKIIRSTGGARKSRRQECHSRPVTVWRSLVFATD
jgi:hypothetical protein